MERSATNKEAETAGEAGEDGMTLTSTAGESEGSGMEDGPGGTVSGGGAISDANSEDADAARSRGLHGAKKKGKREGCWPARKLFRRVLWSGRQRQDTRGLQSGRKYQ